MGLRPKKGMICNSKVMIFTNIGKISVMISLKLWPRWRMLPEVVNSTKSVLDSKRFSYTD